MSSRYDNTARHLMLQFLCVLYSNDLADIDKTPSIRASNRLSFNGERILVWVDDGVFAGGAFSAHVSTKIQNMFNLYL